MSKLNIDQKTIKLLLTDKHSDFLIPDYQRPYAWGEDECATLWDDLFTFAFPNDDCDAFESTRILPRPHCYFQERRRSA